MYDRTSSSCDWLTVNAAYPSCHAKSIMLGNVAFNQCEEAPFMSWTAFDTARDAGDRNEQVNVVCYAADLQSFYLVFARYTAEIREETFASRINEKWLTIFWSKDDVIMQRGVGIRHWSQPSLRDVDCSYHTLVINHQATFILPQRGFSDARQHQRLPQRQAE